MQVLTNLTPDRDVRQLHPLSLDARGLGMSGASPAAVDFYELALVN